MRKHLAHLSNNSIGGDDRHIAVQPRVLSLIEVEDAGLIGSAGPNDLCSHGFIDVFLLKVEHRLQALPLAGIFQQGGLLEAKPVDGLLEVNILLPHVAQIEIVLPDVGYSQFGGVNRPFWGCHQASWPKASAD